MIHARETSWRGPYLDLRSGLFIPRLVTWGMFLNGGANT